jgi:predicted RNase H-like HicB family nuclease
MRNEFTAILERDNDWHVAYCPEIPGANGQGRTGDEARASLAEAIALILEDRREDSLRGVPADAERDTVIVEWSGAACFSISEGWYEGAAILKLSRRMLAQARVIAKGKRIRDCGRLVASYGGRPSQWVKKSSPPFEINGERFEYHWYEHPGIGRVEVKQKQVKQRW